MENNEKITLSASQIAQMNFSETLDSEAESVLTLITAFLKQNRVDLKAISKITDIKITDLEQYRNKVNSLKNATFEDVMKLKKLAAEDLVKSSVQRFPFLIKLVQKTDKDTVDYSDFLIEWTKIIDSLPDKKKREVFDKVLRQHPLELMAIVREIDHNNWLE